MKDEIAGLLEGLISASDGSGPLLQRDYWAVILNCELAPSRLIELVGREFCTFAPEELVLFAPAEDGGADLDVGAELDVTIKFAGACKVRVIHRDANSFTLGTLSGHPEAGRITFGAYRNREGGVVFHIRSRARSSSPAKYAAFVAAGEPMQTTTWTDFVDRVAHRAGDGVHGVIHSSTEEIKDEPDDPATICSPTFIAEGE
jgi:hypothetical protein